MVKRHTTVPYQFHCLTDDPTGLDTDINVIKLPTDPSVKSWWSKLWMFAPEMPLKGNMLFFDLDVVIFDNIDPLFTHPGKFNIIRDYLWNEFKERSAQIMQQNHGDQDWITKRAKDDISWFPDEWIRSYKWELVGLKDNKLLTNKDGKKWFREPVKIKPDNRVAVFHGLPNPMESADEWVIKNWK